MKSRRVIGIKNQKEEEDKVIGTFEVEPTPHLITVEKMPDDATEPYFYFFNDKDLAHSTSAARISLLGPWYVTKGTGIVPDFELDVYQIAGLIDFLHAHPENEEFKHLTNWQYCLKLFNMENKGTKFHIDEDLEMPDYAKGLIEPLIEMESYEHHLGFYEIIMDDLESMILKRLYRYEPGADNPHFYDHDIIDILYDPKTAEDFLEMERDFLNSYFQFESEDELKEEIRGLLASKRYEICTRQEGVKDVIRRELRRQITKLTNEN